MAVGIVKRELGWGRRYEIGFGGIAETEQKMQAAVCTVFLAVGWRLWC